MMAHTFDEAVDQFVDCLRVRSNSRAIYRIQAADKHVQEARADMTELVMALAASHTALMTALLEWSEDLSNTNQEARLALLAEARAAETPFRSAPVPEHPDQGE